MQCPTTALSCTLLKHDLKIERLSVHQRFFNCCITLLVKMSFGQTNGVSEIMTDYYLPLLYINDCLISPDIDFGRIGDVFPISFFYLYINEEVTHI